ncbi:DUF5106 domain-containing protein [Bacteroides pyogenes]|uniref:DUF5106 domain-containing protein n=1 Tax=Bacteroides pyogenes TaxID=310300 RepID=UPI002A91F1B4|nr:DUF5106 domain-containing protein [Bacteroides pyogenes]MDY5433475.1 DUF5106 domain-containing protein [Bacteroides pyogenes]
MKAVVRSLVFLFCVPLCACKNGNASNTRICGEAAQDTVKAIVLPAIPPMFTTIEQRADFLVKHYWDNVNFADTNYIHHPDVTEQAWVDYCDLLKHVPLSVAQDAVRATIKRTEADKKVFVYITDLADKYLYDPNSPMRNEEHYIPVLDAMIASPLLDETEKIRPRARRELAQKNRRGTKALDFSYTTASGAQGSLYGVKAAYTLLFINNPGCYACTAAIEELKTAPTISSLHRNNRLAVLSVYPDDEPEEWKKHLTDFPKSWINGYDKHTAIKNRQIYDLKAIPTLYLLDREKNVLLKDATVQAIEEYLSTTAR